MRTSDLRIVFYLRLPTHGGSMPTNASRKKADVFQIAWFVTVMSAPIWKLIAYFALWISTVPSEGVMAAVDLRLQSAEQNYWQANVPMLEVSWKHHRATGAFMRNVRTNSQSIEHIHHVPLRRNRLTQYACKAYAPSTPLFKGYVMLQTAYMLTAKGVGSNPRCLF